MHALQGGPEHHVFLLRLWHMEGHQGRDWRASLERPASGQRLGFASLEQLFAYLIELGESTHDVRQPPAPTHRT